MKKLILASNSPRRRELLKLIVPEFEIATPVEVDEVYPSDLSAHEVAPYLSRLKANAYRSLLGDNDVLLTADTVVIVDDKILGKPADENQAFEMLRLLSGRSHDVVTGYTLTALDKTVTRAVATQVFFDNLADDTIRRYIDKYHPMDKAGAYGIQEWIGCVGISHINGCFYNVMGLPLYSLAHSLRDFMEI